MLERRDPRKGIALNVTAYVESPDHVCCRYRLAALRPFLAQAGYSLDYRPFPRNLWRRVRGDDSAEGEIAILQRRLPSALELWRIRRSHRFLIFDFDDAIWLRDSYSARGLHSAKRLRRFRRVLQASDLVVAGNEFLAAQAARFIDSSRIHVVPTCVDPRKYPMATHGLRGTVDLVWIGSSSTLQGLEKTRPILEAIGRSVPNVRLKLICDRFLSLNHLQVVASAWDEATEASELAAADIGIAWMPDDDWSRGKCGLKLLQYMAAGLPVIANPAGVHREMIEHGGTGCLAETEQQWLDAVRILAGQPRLRLGMGSAGRRRVKVDYSIHYAGQRWLEILGQLQERRMAV